MKKNRILYISIVSAVIQILLWATTTFADSDKYEFRVISDIKNFVLIAPRFDGIYNATLAEMERKERKKEKFDFPLLKDFYLVKYQQLLNPRNEHRSDLKLIEIFNVFNEQLIKRERFHLDGEIALISIYGESILPEQN